MYSATKAHPLTFDALFFTLALLQAVRVAEWPSVRRAALLGLVIGVGALSRGTIVIFLAVVGIWLLVRTPVRSWLMPLRLGLVVGVCAAAVVAPWTIRNSLLHDRFVFLLTTDAEDFWRGNNPWATGHSYTGSRPIMKALPADVLKEIRSQPGELAQADWYRQQATAFVRENPRRFVRLTLTKFYQFWWFAAETGVLYPRAWRWAYMAYYVAVLGLTLAGMLAVPRTRTALEQLALIIAFVLAISALQSLFFVEGRHRWAVEPLMLVLSGGGAAALVNRGRAAPA